MKSTSTCMMIAALAVGACGGTAPQSAESRQNLYQEARLTLNSMQARDPSLTTALGGAAGYAVFPKIGKGGFIAGAAHGRGILFEGGQASGYVELNQASIGAQIGAKTFSELIIFQNHSDVQNLKNGTFKFGADVAAVALTAGAARSTSFRNGVAVIVESQGGLMADLSVNGQKINFMPMGG